MYIIKVIHANGSLILKTEPMSDKDVVMGIAKKIRLAFPGSYVAIRSISETADIEF